MGINSDGDKQPPDKKHNLRSNSTGNINLNQAEINQIIGINKETASKYLKTFVDKPQKKFTTRKDNNTKDLPGHSNDPTLTKESFITPDASQIFKPKNPLPRTPPNKDTENNPNALNNLLIQTEDVFSDNNENFQQNKRPRTGSSPASLEKNRVKRQNNKQNTPITPSTSDLEFFRPTEQILNEVLNALETLQKSTEKLPQNEVHLAQSAVFAVHKHVTALAFRIGQTEKTNIELEQKIKDLTLISASLPTQINSPKPTFAIPPPPSKKPAFSEVLKASKFTLATNNPASKPEILEWKTPPQKPKHESLIKINNQTNSRLVLQEIKKCVKDTNIEGNFKRVRQLQNGAVIIECQNATQQQKLNDSLRNRDIEIKRISNNDPMVMITGILKGFSHTEFIKEFIAENLEILDTFGLNAADLFKFVTKRECRNKSKENWIFQTPPELFKWLIRNNDLTFDLSPVYVQEYTNVAFCFRCCLFGHVSKYCTGKECCYKCGEAHNVTKCEATVNNCPSCSKLKLDNRNHTARDPNCPVFNQRLQRQQQSTNYSNEPFLEQK